MRYLLIFFLFTAEVSHADLPHDFYYQDEPIPHSILQSFFSQAIVGFGNPRLELDLTEACKKDIDIIDEDLNEQEENEEEYTSIRTDFEWKYIGAIHPDLHIVWAYTWEVGCLGKFTGLLLLKRVKDQLHITDILYGGDRHANMIRENAEINGNAIFYTKHVTSADVIEIALRMYPDLQELYNSSSKNRIRCGEGAFEGAIHCKAIVQKEAFSETLFLSFTPTDDHQIDDLSALHSLALYLLSDEEQ